MKTKHLIRFQILEIILCISNFSLAQNKNIKSYAPELFPPGISGSVCGFSKDSRTIYFTRVDTLANKTFLYQAIRTKKRWSAIKLLPFSGSYNDYGGRLSMDGMVFYFTSDRPGANTKSDDAWNIWMTQKRGDAWLTPKPVVDVNTPGSECCPLPMSDSSIFFSADRGEKNNWLIYKSNNGLIQIVDGVNNSNAWQWPSYFSKYKKLLLFNSMLRSDTHGMDDIYVSMLDKNGIWSDGINLGHPVNTKAFEDGAILTPDNKWLIFGRHTTPESVSEVLCIKWKKINKKIG